MDDRLTLPSSSSLENLFALRDALKNDLTGNKLLKPVETSKGESREKKRGVIHSRRKLCYQFLGGSVSVVLFRIQWRSISYSKNAYPQPRRHC